MIRLAPRLACALPLAAAACGGHTSALPYYRTKALTPEWLADAAASSPAMHRVAPFALVDQRGARVTADSLAGRATVVRFFYTTCGGVCPLTQPNLARLLASLAGEPRVRVLSHSVTPERDSVARLRAYAAAHRITDPRWHLLTGPRAEVERLARRSYFVNLDDGRSYGVTDLAHTETVVLVDGRGRLRGVYTGTLRLDMQRLAEDIRTLLNER